jgi:hypothetical protein
MYVRSYLQGSENGRVVTIAMPEDREQLNLNKAVANIIPFTRRVFKIISIWYPQMQRIESLINK